MLKSEVKRKLTKLCAKDGSTILFDHPFSGHSTISIGGKVGAWYAPESIEGLKEVRDFLDGKRVRTVVVGGGSNILMGDDGMDAVVISLSGDAFTNIVRQNNIVVAGSGVKLSKLISFCSKEGLSGLEGLVGIPATVGGALFMNASYREAISDHLFKVLILDSSGRLKLLESEDMEFSYRFSYFKKGDIVLQAFFSLRNMPPDMVRKRASEYLSEKKSKQPLDKKTLGCVFKNPKKGNLTSGEMIDKSGMKGLTRGGAKVSEKHANFIVNTGGATSGDVVDLMNEIKKKVKEKFSVDMEPEIEILDDGK